VYNSKPIHVIVHGQRGIGDIGACLTYKFYLNKKIYFENMKVGDMINVLVGLFGTHPEYFTVVGKIPFHPMGS